MKMKRKILFAAIVILPALMLPAYAQSALPNFITRSGDRLMDGATEFRFISFNVPNLHMVEDNLTFSETNPWRLPDEFEIRDTFDTINQTGGRVVRSYVISVHRADDDPAIPRHVLGPGRFNEEAFRALDKVLQLANEKGIRVIVPFVDQWKWWGGIGEYAAFRGKRAEEFWTDPQLIADFKQTIAFLINRKNTYTGTLYKDDRAIMAWETGNELNSPYSWSKEIAAYIKSLDSNHLVIDGNHVGNNGLQTEIPDDPNIDIITAHYYPGQKPPPVEAIEQTKRQIAGRKAFFVGEFGFIPTEDVRKLLDKVIAERLSGALVWSLRFHNRDGGFYWHSEGAADNSVKAYHWPGFQTGQAYDGTNLVRLMREKAYEIRGEQAPALPAPSPPAMLPIKSAYAISWRGSAGAYAYDVERATVRRGPWTIVGADIDDTLVQYRPLFADIFAEQGREYFYRVRAKNATGTSEPSNIVGPVRVDSLFVVDEMRDLGRVFSHGGPLAIETKDQRKAKEDIYRLKGGKDSWIVYRGLYPLRSIKVMVFFEREVSDFDFLVSSDGTSFKKVEAARRDHFKGTGDYGYWKPVTYEISSVPAGNYFVKLIFKTDAQISRIEIEHGK